MPTSTTYHNVFTWFSVDILHNYFLRKYTVDTGNTLTEEIAVRPELKGQYELKNLMSVVPTVACRQAMKNYGLYFRETRTGFFMGIEGEESNGLVYSKLNTPDDLVLSFELHLNDTLWFNYSDLPLGGIGSTTHVIDDRAQDFRNIYYFSNTKDNYPSLATANTLSEATLDTDEDVQSSYDYPVSPNAFGLIEIHAFVDTGAQENLQESGILNLFPAGSGYTNPEFVLEVESRSLVWKFLKKDGSEKDRTALALPFSRIQINPVPMQTTGNLETLPNPRPDNIKYESNQQQYVAEVYL